MLMNPSFAEKVIVDLKELFKAEPFITAPQITELSYRFIEPLLDLLEMNLADLENSALIFKDFLSLLSKAIPLESSNLKIGFGEDAMPDLFLKEKIKEIFKKHSSEALSAIDKEKLFKTEKEIYPILYKLLHEYRLNKNSNRPDLDDINLLRIYQNLPPIDAEKPLSYRLKRLQNEASPPRVSEIDYVIRVLFILKSDGLGIIENFEKPTDDSREDAIVTAIKYGFSDLVESLLVAKKVDPNLMFEEVSLLGAACLFQDYPTVAVLVKHGAVGDKEIKLRDHQTTPFHIACALGNIKIVSSVMSTTTDVNKKTSDGNTALGLAIDNNHIPVVQHVASDPRAKKSLDEVDQGGMTPVVRACVKGHTEIVNLLLEGGANVPYALFLAAKSGNVTILEALLAQPGIRKKINDTHEGFSPLMVACMFSNIPTARALVAVGADLATIGSDALMIAGEKNNIPVMEFLLSEEKIHRIVNEPLSTGFTPLTFAAAKGYLRQVELLVRAGAVLTAGDANGYTPLKGAAEMGCTQVVDFLKKAEREVAKANQSGINFAYRPAHQYTVNDISQLNVAGIAAYKKQDFDKAINIFNIVINLFRKYYPENNLEAKRKLAAVLFNLGSAKLQLKQTREAWPHLVEAAATCSSENKEKYRQRLNECEKTLSALTL
jgi:ankyrin repeat protein